jgi:hypothetical protein
MFEGGRYGMIAWLEDAEDGEVQRIGGIVGETKTIWIRAVKEFCEHLSGIVNNCTCLHTEIIARTTRIDAKIPVEMIHEGIDLFRFRE